MDFGLNLAGTPPPARAADAGTSFLTCQVRQTQRLTIVNRIASNLQFRNGAERIFQVWIDENLVSNRRPGLQFPCHDSHPSTCHCSSLRHKRERQTHRYCDLLPSVHSHDSACD